MEKRETRERNGEEKRRKEEDQCPSDSIISSHGHICHDIPSIPFSSLPLSLVSKAPQRETVACLFKAFQGTYNTVECMGRWPFIFLYEGRGSPVSPYYRFALFLS